MKEQNGAELLEENEQPVCDRLSALQKAEDLQRFVEEHSSDLGEGCVKAADHLLNCIRRTPLHSGQKQATLDEIFAN